MSDTAWRRWDTELHVGSDRESEDSVIGIRTGFWLHCSVFKKRLPDERARNSMHSVSEGHTLRWCPTRSRAPKKPKCWCQPVPSFRRSKSRPACGAKGQTSHARGACQTVGPDVGRRSAPTCASPPARRARGRPTPYRWSTFSPSTRTPPALDPASCFALRRDQLRRQRARPRGARRRHRRGTRGSRVGVCFALKTRSNSASAARRRPPAVVEVDDRAGEEALGRVRMQRPRTEAFDRGVARPRAATRSRTGSTWGARRRGSTSACRTARRAVPRCRRSCRATSTSSARRRGRRAAAW